MTFRELQTLVEYHYWARDRVLEAVEALTPEEFTRDLGNSFKSVRDTLVHCVGADWVWRSRWEGTSPAALFDAAGFADVASVRERWTEEEQRLRAFLDRLGEDGLERTFEYRMFDGTPSAQPFWQALQHLVNHGSYHRGQITTMLRQLGAAGPKPTDLIAFYRLKNAAPG